MGIDTAKSGVAVERHCDPFFAGAAAFDADHARIAARVNHGVSPDR